MQAIAAEQMVEYLAEAQESLAGHAVGHRRRLRTLL